MNVTADQIVTKEVFAALYPKDQALISRMAESMRGPDGFREGHDLSVWVDQDSSFVLVDGHQRLDAAKLAGIVSVPIVAIPVNNERQALEWAIREQRDRRNLTEKDRRAHDARAIAALDRSKAERIAARGGDKGSREPLATDGSSAERTATIVGTSATTVKRVRKVLDSNDEALKEKLLSGEITPKAAAREVKKKSVASMGPTGALAILLGDAQPEPKKRRRRASQKDGPPQDGMRLARQAAGVMNEIRNDDTQKADAFAFMRSWLNAHEA